MMGGSDSEPEGVQCEDLTAFNTCGQKLFTDADSVCNKWQADIQEQAQAKTLAAIQDGRITVTGEGPSKEDIWLIMRDVFEELSDEFCACLQGTVDCADEGKCTFESNPVFEILNAQKPEGEDPITCRSLCSGSLCSQAGSASHVAVSSLLVGLSALAATAQ